VSAAKAPFTDPKPTAPTPTVPASRPPAKRKWGPWLVAGAFAAVLIAVVLFVTLRSSPSHPVVVVTTSTTTTPPSTTTTVPSTPVVSPASQAAEITRLLSPGPSERSALQSSVDVVQQSVDSGSCSAGVPGAVTEIGTIANDRAVLLSQLSSVSLSAIPNGSLALSDLKSAWQISGRIDRAFEQWASEEESNDCSVSDSDIPSYQATATLDPISTSMKARFVSIWNPIAESLNQPANWTADEI
jgi:hypothetical protein